MTVPPTGWYVEIDDPQTGHTWTPDVVGQPEVKPGANTYPKASIPVRRRERWFDPRFRGAPMRVWRDGERQPIDQLEEPVETEDRVALNGRGGVEMDERVTKEVEQQEAHLVAEEIIKNNTSYTANVDEPAAETRDDVVFQNPDTQSEWESVLDIPATTAAYIDSGRLKAAQVAFFAEGESITGDGKTLTESAASDGAAQGLSIGSAKLSASTDYTIPASDAAVAIRYRVPSGDTSPGFDLEIDGESVLGATSGALPDGEAYDWLFGSGLSSDLGAGSHTAGIELRTTGEDIIIDAVVLYDDRFSYTFDNSVDSNGYLSGPEPFPGRVEVETTDAATAFQFSGARLDASYDDTSNQQRVGVSSDQGASYTFSDNSEVVETDFGTGSPEIRGKLGLSRYGTRSTASPTSGINGQTVDLYELAGDINETPLLINQDYDDSIINVLRDISEQSDFIFEYRLRDGTPSIEMTVPGQRVSSDDPDVSGYRYSRSTEDQVKRVVVKGGRQQQREETFTADHGTAVDLAQGNIDHGTEVVYEPDTGESFAEGEDYRLSPGVETDTGTITTLSGGSMTDGSSYAIDYAYHNEGVASSSDAGANPDTLVRELPAVTAQRGCEQAATILLRQLEQPLEEATVRLPAAAGFDVVDSQQFAPLPSDTTWEIRQITTNAGETEFVLGTRETIDEIARRIQRRLSAAASRT